MIDMANGASGRPHAHHGEQVGVSTILVAALWQRIQEHVADGTIGELILPSVEEAESAVRGAFKWMDPEGATADECWSDYSKKLDRLSRSDASAQLVGAQREWPTHQKTLDTMLLAPERIVAALREAGAPTPFRDLSQPIPAKTVEWALTNCHLMRDRFTVADLAYLTRNWGPEDVASVIEEADALGAGL